MIKIKKQVKVLFLLLINMFSQTTLSIPIIGTFRNLVENINDMSNAADTAKQSIISNKNIAQTASDNIRALADSLQVYDSERSTWWQWLREHVLRMQYYSPEVVQEIQRSSQEAMDHAIKLDEAAQCLEDTIVKATQLKQQANELQTEMLNIQQYDRINQSDLEKIINLANQSKSIHDGLKRCLPPNLQENSIFYEINNIENQIANLKEIVDAELSYQDITVLMDIIRRRVVNNIVELVRTVNVVPVALAIGFIAWCYKKLS